jgi:hypothetical protein
MVKVYLTKKFVKNIRYLPVLYPILGELKDEKRLFADLGERAFKEPVFNLTENIEEADFILFPHDFYFFMVGMIPQSFLDEHVSLAEKYQKKLLIFDLSDLTEREINVPYSIVFRIAGYTHRQKENEIVMPTFIEDLSSYRKVFWREKSEKPSIGFCGRAGFKNLRERLGSLFKNTLITLKIIFGGDKNLETHRPPIAFRMKVMKILEKCPRLLTNFVVRRSYSSHVKTVELPPEELRKQYIATIVDSDFTLCVRGDANSSCRFFEALSLGRIPLVVDTDCAFPLKDVIDYSKFSVFIDHKDIKKICGFVENFYNKISGEKFIEMQKAARAAFENYLSTTAFLKYILPVLASKESLH